MRTASVVIPLAYEEELVFLKRNLHQIRKFHRTTLPTEVLVIDQTESGIPNDLMIEYSSFARVIKAPRIDAGWPIDVAASMAEGYYFCSLDVDCIPIHPNWLLAPIKLIEKYDLLFVGKQTGLHMHPGYAKWGNFVQINNYFRVGKTREVRSLSRAVGFLRPENRYKVNFTPVANCEFEQNADNGVVANFYSDQINMGAKLSLSMNKILGMTNEMGVFGHTIDNLVWHMVFSSSKDWISNKEKTLGEDYMHWYRRIQETNFSDFTFDDMLAHLKDHHNLLGDREIFSNGVLRTLTQEDEICRDIEVFKSA